jgi:hypothetical protein
MVGATGFEPAQALGQTVDTDGTRQQHFSATPCYDNGSEEDIEDTGGHVEDSLASSPCCPYVAHHSTSRDLTFVIDYWEGFPEHVRQAILILARSAVNSEQE